MIQDKERERDRLIFFFILFSSVLFVYCVSIKNIIHPDVYHFLLYGEAIDKLGTIPHYSLTSIYPDLKITLQEWFYDIFIYKIFDNFGIFGLIVNQTVMFLILSILVYKQLKKRSSSYAYLVFGTMVTMLIFGYSLSIRPILLTYILLLSELIFIEKYAKTNKLIYLISFPILLIVEMNVHASYWIFHYLFLLPFLMPGLNFKHLEIETYKVKRLPLMLMGIFSIPALFLTPYGVDSITYIFKAVFIPMDTLKIDECQPLPISSVEFILLTGFLLFFIFLIRKRSINSFDFYFIIGIMLVSYMMQRNFSFMAFAILIMIEKDTVADFFTNVIDNDETYKRLLSRQRLLKVCTIVLCVVVAFAFVSNFIHAKRAFVSDCDLQPFAAIEYMDEHSKSKTVLNDISAGTHLEYNGYKVLIDYCSETYAKALNGKYDIAENYANIKTSSKFKEYASRCEYALARPGTFLDKRVRKSGEFEEVLDTDFYTLYKNKEF